MLVVQHSRGGRRGLIAVCIGLFVLTGVGVAIMTTRQSHESTHTIASPQGTAASARDVRSRMLVVGDVFWSRYTNDAAKKSPLGYAFPFARLGEFHRESYNAWIGDMECPLSNGPQPTSAEEEAALSFDCDPAYLPEAKKWFTAMTLANNHTDNRGTDGFMQTQENLAKNGIQYFGHYNPENLDNICDVLSIPAQATLSDGTTKTVSLPIAWCGYHGVFQIPTQASVDVMKRYAAVMPVIAMPHSGKEYQPGPDQIKTTLYRSMVDAGADVVIGDHPHWVQSTEAYKGHLIVYGLGNFMFDQQFNREVTRAAALDMTVRVTTADNPDLEKWLAIGEHCGAYHDTCLQKATEAGLKKLQLRYGFDVVATDDTGYQTHPADAALSASTRTRLQWDQTMRGLTGLYSAEAH